MRVEYHPTALLFWSRDPQNSLCSPSIRHECGVSTFLGLEEHLPGKEPLVLGRAHHITTSRSAVRVFVSSRALTNSPQVTSARRRWFRLIFAIGECLYGINHDEMAHRGVFPRRAGCSVDQGVPCGIFEGSFRNQHGLRVGIGAQR